MNIGDKVIAVGKGRKTIELNDGVFTRTRGGDYASLVGDMVVMTVKEINGNEVRTGYYLFHADDLHLADIEPVTSSEPTVMLGGRSYTASELQDELDALLG